MSESKVLPVLYSSYSILHNSTFEKNTINYLSHERSAVGGIMVLREQS